MGGTSGHHSPSPRDQFVQEQQQILNAATASGNSKKSGKTRSPSGNFKFDCLYHLLYLWLVFYFSFWLINCLKCALGERPVGSSNIRSPGYMSSWKNTLSAWASNTSAAASSNLPSISSLRLRTASSDRASVIPGRGGASTEDSSGHYSYMTGDNSSSGFDSRRFQPR